jgi:type IV pilus assembly protein PilC
MEGDRTVRAALRHLEQGVRAGGALGPSLTQLGASPHVQMLVAGGERTGRLTAALRSAGVLTARIEALRSTVRRALVYPVVVLVIGLAILTVIAIGVVPPLERTFADLGGELPRATRIVLAASRPLSSPAALGMVAAAAGAVALVRRWSGDGGSARLLGSILPPWWHTTIAPLARRAADHLPLTGRLRRELRLTVIAHVMATLVRGGVPLDVALEHVADGLPSGVTRQALLDAASATRQGTGPVDGRGLGRLLGTAEREMLRVGERHGLLAEQWERVAQRRDAALEDRMVRLGVVMEPLLVALVGAVVGGAVLALYLPTFRVMDLL